MSTFTTTSPTSAGELPDGFTEIGGIVLDLIGINGVRVVSQLSASSLFEGFFSTNPGTIGTQSGFTPEILDALGGGLAEVAVRVTLYDGDTAPGNFDFNANELLLNGHTLGNFSDVATRETDSLGNETGSTGTGFENERLDTGWFYSTDSGFLSDFYNSLTSGSVDFQLNDTSSVGDNYFDFTQGIDGGLVDVGAPPNVSPQLDLNGADPGTSAHLNYLAGDPAAVIAPASLVADADSPNFDGGSLTVSFTSNGTTNDQLSIQHQGNGAGQIGVSGSDVSYEGAVIGTFSGGGSGSDLVVTFNASATPDAAKALLWNITFFNGADPNDPGFAEASVRTLQFTLDDGDGSSTSAEATINVGPVVGTDGDDNLVGTPYDDTILGLAGNDIIRAKPGDDIVLGGDGNDNIAGGKGNDTLYGGDQSADSGFDDLWYAAETGESGIVVNLSDTQVDDTGVPGASFGTLAAHTAIDTFGDIDSIFGFEGIGATQYDDIMFGSDADELFRPFFGDDYVDGGGGTDEVAYHGETGEHGAVVNLSDTARNNPFSEGQVAPGTAYDTGGGTDTLLNIENVRGSPLSDYIYGNDGDNRFRGLAGNDVIDGGAGSDTVDHRRDADNGGTNGVIVNLSDRTWDASSGQLFALGATAGIVDPGKAQDGFGDIDTLTSIENAIGTESDDDLIGNDEDNRLRGEGGNDRLLGLGGDDNLDGGAGDDELIGGSGRDNLRGGDGNDVLDGGEEGDHLEGGAGDDTIYAVDNINGVGDFILPGLGTNTILGSAVFNGANRDGHDLSFQDIQSGVNASLVTGKATATGMDTTFSEVHYLIGSGHDDVLSGGVSDFDSFEGYVGLAGDDTIDGGSGWDRVDYRFETENGYFDAEGERVLGTQGVNVNLGAGVATDSYGDTDTLIAIEAVRGTHFADVMVGSSGRNRLQGEAGDDTLSGGGDRDSLDGGTGDDTVDGGDGDDFIRGTAGADDFADGGADFDVIGFSNSLNGGSGNIAVDLTVGVFGAGKITGAIFDGSVDTDFINVERVEGTEGNDSFTAADGVPASGTGGPFEVVGAAGTDTFTDETEGGVLLLNYDAEKFAHADFDGDWGNDGVAEEPGVAVNASGRSVANPFATGMLAAGTARDTFGNTDVLDGIRAFRLTDANDYFWGNGLGAYVEGRGGEDQLSGSVNDDELHGGDGNDQLNGSAGDDELYGDAGDDVLLGGAGDDQLSGGVGADILDGGSGSDTASYAGSSSRVLVRLWNGTGEGGDAEGDTLTSVENLIGSDHNDLLIGSNSGTANKLSGGAGNDFLSGLSGDDVLDGGDGADILQGGAGEDEFLNVSGDDDQDVLTGGADDDTYRIAFAPGSVADLVTDFDTGNSDIIDITQLLAMMTGLPSGANPFDAGFMRLVQDGADTNVQVDFDGPTGGANWTTVLVLDGTQAASLTANNFSADGYSSGSLNPQHKPPVAMDDTAATNEDSNVIVAVLANDTTDPDETLTVESFSNGTHGAVTGLPDGTLRYTPAADFNGSDTFTYTVSDGNGGTDTATVTVTVNAVNDAPVGTIAPTTFSATEQTALSLKGSGLSVSDVDAGGNDVTVTLSVGVGSLTASAGGSGVAVAGSGTSTLTLTGSVAEINALLNTDSSSLLNYINNSDAPPASTVLTLNINDGGHTGSGGAKSASDTATINIAAVNDAPGATITPTAYSATAQTALNLKNTGLSVSDVDAGSGIVTATLSVGSGVLNASPGTSGAAVSGSDTSTLTLTGTLAQINALLNTNGSSSISYINNSATPPPSTVLTLNVDDGGNTGSGGAKSASDTATIGIGAANVAPTNAVPGAQTADRNVPLDLSSLAVADPDSATLVTTLAVTAGILNVGTAGGATVSGAGTSLVTVSGTPTQVNAVLNTVTFLAPVETLGPVTLTVTTSDGLASDVDNVTINISGLVLQNQAGNVFGGASGDFLTGDTGANAIRGYDGNDFLGGGGGDDQLFGEGGDDKLVGGTGNDQVLGGLGNDELSLGDGDDQGWGGEGDDNIDGGTGNDRIFGEGGDDHILGGAGDDYVTGGLGNDTIELGDGYDQAWGGEGIDFIDGGAGNDGTNLPDGTAATGLAGGAGDDVILGGAGNDNIWGDADNDKLDGGADDDQLAGGDGNDEVFGGTGNDNLWGDAGDDELNGGAGDDQLSGGTGNDTLIFDGTGGNDIGWGGAGDDTFVFLPGFGGDIIKDFSTASGDLLSFQGYGANQALEATTIPLDGNTGTLITVVGTGDAVILEGVRLADLTTADYEVI